MAGRSDQVIDQVNARDMERAVFVGHSMGGLLVQALWRRHPDRFVGLALVSITDEAWTPHPRRLAASWRHISVTSAHDR